MNRYAKKEKKKDFLTLFAFYVHKWVFHQYDENCDEKLCDQC